MRRSEPDLRLETVGRLLWASGHRSGATLTIIVRELKIAMARNFGIPKQFATGISGQ